MIKGDQVRLHAGSPLAGLLPRPDAIGIVREEDGFRLWVLFKDPDRYADGWPVSEFERVTDLVAQADQGCSDEG